MTKLTIEANTSTSLNFLIYIQNLYLSQRESGDNRFPSYRVPFAVFHERFEENFKDLWEIISTRMEENPTVDQQLFYEEKELFSSHLFNNQAVFAVKFDDIHRTFQNWWGSFAGSFAIGRAADNKISQLYAELAQKYSEKEFANKISVSILYDECMFADLNNSHSFIITSIPEIYRRYSDVIDRILTRRGLYTEL